MQWGSGTVFWSSCAASSCSAAAWWWKWWYRDGVVDGPEEIKQWRRQHLAKCDSGVSILDDDGNDNHDASGLRRSSCRLAQAALWFWSPTTTTTTTSTSTTTTTTSTTTRMRLPRFGDGSPPMMIRPPVPLTLHTLVYNMMMAPGGTTATSGGRAAAMAARRHGSGSGWYGRYGWWSRTGGIVKNGNDDDDDGSSALLLYRLVREVIVKQGMQHRQHRRHHSLLDVGCGIGSLYDHVHDVVAAYHGVALTGPEIELARTWHHHHCRQSGRPASSSSSTTLAATATFQQRDFLVTDNDDDDRASSFRPDSAFSTIVAIDSLVYGAGCNKLHSVLDHLIHNALQPGGLFIIVDDVRYGYDDDDATTTSKNDDLWTYQQWQETLGRLGCPMVFAQDLSMEYWLDFATPIHIYSNSHHHRCPPPSFGRRRWWWFHFLDTMLLPADRDFDELLRRDQQRLVRHWQRRQQRHRDAQLMYHLYACRRHVE